MPFIAVVTLGVSASGTRSHLGILELFDVSGENLRFCAGGKCSTAGIVTARLHPCRCLHVSRLVTDKARPGRKRNTLIDEINSNAHGFGSQT